MAARFPRTLRFVLTVTLACAVSVPAAAAGRGAIETPSYRSTQTGVGLISGWNCSGRKIEIRIDDGPLRTAGAHTSREDTRTVCGRADTGFGLLINFNLLAPGLHRLTAYADGIEFTQWEFSTIRIGNPVVNPARFPLLNFPRVGMTTVVEWDRELLNFRADEVATAPPLAGDYYGATTRSDCNGLHEVRHATFTVTYDKAVLGVTIHYTDGSTATFPPTIAALQEDGFVKAEYGDWSFSIDGTALRGGVRRPVDDPCFLDTVAHGAK